MEMEIWEVESWDAAEFAEQAMAEMAFAQFLNVQHVLDGKDLSGNVAGYRVRRAPDGLVLIHSDNDDDIFVAVRVVKQSADDGGGASCCIEGWLRGSEGKRSQFFQKGWKNCWVVPFDALHRTSELPDQSGR
jgi:hypothetical protein